MTIVAHVLAVESNWSALNWSALNRHSYLSALNLLNVVVVFHNWHLNCLHGGLGYILELIFIIFYNLLVGLQSHLVTGTQAINLISKLSFLHLVDLGVVYFGFFLATFMHLNLNLLFSRNNLHRFWSLLEP